MVVAMVVRCPFCGAGAEAIMPYRPARLEERLVTVPVFCRSCENTWTLRWRGRHADHWLLAQAHRLGMPVKQLAEAMVYAMAIRLALPVEEGVVDASGYSQQQFWAAVRDLAEHGWVQVEDPGFAEALRRSAVEAVYPARVRESGPGWWMVEITDMRPRSGRKEDR